MRPSFRVALAEGHFVSVSSCDGANVGRHLYDKAVVLSGYDPIFMTSFNLKWKVRASTHEEQCNSVQSNVLD